jgi:mannose-6-phosphate isomerase-like protein (cupin superfamily)
VPEEAGGVARSIQEPFVPEGVCFGCGRANPRGLRLRSYLRAETVVAQWQPEPQHAAIPDVCGEVIGTLIDCHSGAALAQKVKDVEGRWPWAQSPGWAIAELTVSLLRPTPIEHAVGASRSAAGSARGQAPLRPDQPVPPQPERRALIAVPDRPHPAVVLTTPEETMRTRALAALSAVALGLTVTGAATVLPASAHDPAAVPIAIEPLGPRASFPDDISIKLKAKPEGSATTVVNLRDASHLAVARIIVQPGARFPLHTHPGPVIVSVIEGELTYVVAASCEERVYPAGTAFVDTGTDVHTAYGSSTGVTTLIATFLSTPATGPLTLPEPDQSSTCP